MIAPRSLHAIRRIYLTVGILEESDIEASIQTFKVIARLQGLRSIEIDINFPWVMWTTYHDVESWKEYRHKLELRVLEGLQQIEGVKEFMVYINGPAIGDTMPEDPRFRLCRDTTLS